jgi:uncharacterized membrane protein
MDLITSINFLLLIYLLVTVYDLKKRINKLSPEKTTISVQKEPVKQKKEVEEVAESPAEPDEETSIGRFFTWFSRDWPLKVGALFILFGFVWLVTYAFMNNWIGPAGRIIIGLLAGSAIFIWGSARIKINIYQGEILATLGAGVILVSIYAAQYIYKGMFPPSLALVLVIGVTAAITYISYVNNTVRLAVLGLLVGGAAPLLIGSDIANILGLFSYLFCLVIGVVWLVRITGWRRLTILSLIIIWGYSIPWFSTILSPSELLYMRFAAVTFTTLFYLLSLAAFVVDRSTKREDIAIAFLIALYSLHWILTVVPPHWQSMVFAGLAICFMLGSLAIFRIHRIAQPTYLYTAVAIGFLIAATVKQFDGALLSVMLATEAVALTVYADRVLGKKFITGICVLYILPLLLSIDLLSNFHYTFTHQISLIYIGVSLYAGSAYLLWYKNTKDTQIDSLGRLICIAAGIYTLVYVWISMPYYLGYSNLLAARVITLILYAAAGVSLNLYGTQTNHLRTRQFGFGLVIFVIAHLLMVEVWDMMLGARIVTFFAIGIILVTSVFFRRIKNEKHT